MNVTMIRTMTELKTNTTIVHLFSIHCKLMTTVSTKQISTKWVVQKLEAKVTIKNKGRYNKVTTNFS